MRIAPALVLSLALLVAGCLDDSGPTEVDGASPTDSSSGTDTAGPSKSPSPTDGGEVVPKYHPHDYWGGRQEVHLFSEFPVRLGEDPPHETIYRTSQVVVGYREFDTRMDGDHSTSIDQADTVFQGTRDLVVKIDWAASENIKGLTFHYKPANSARFHPVTDVQNGAEYTIPLGRGMADMAHQLSLSRWRFALEAFDPSMDGVPQQVHVAQGTAKVTIRAINGGEKYLDEPHPYFFLDSDERFEGEIFKNVSSKVVNATPVPYTVGDALDGWKVPPPHIVPWDSNQLRVWLYYNYTGSADDVPHPLGLVYTDASGTTKKYPAPVESTATSAYYEIPVYANQADTPYATTSDWTWGVHPVVADQQDLGGEFEGDVKLVVHARGHSDPAAMEG